MSHAIRNPIPPGDHDKDSPYAKMPFVYRQYGIHLKGDEYYVWFDRGQFTPEQVKAMVAECGDDWEAVYRSVSEAFIL